MLILACGQARAAPCQEFHHDSCWKGRPQEAVWVSCVEWRGPAQVPWHRWPCGRRGGGGPGVGLGTMENHYCPCSKWLNDTVSKPHSQTIGKAVNRSTQLSKHSRAKLRKAKRNRLNRSFGRNCWMLLMPSEREAVFRIVETAGHSEAVEADRPATPALGACSAQDQRQRPFQRGCLTIWSTCSVALLLLKWKHL